MKGPASVLALLLLFGITVAADAEYLIKFSHTAGTTTAKGRAADHFAELVNERLAGKIKVEVFPDGVLFDDADVIEAVRRATGDIGIMAAPNISSFVDVAGGLGVFDLPFLFDRIEDVHRLVDSPVGGKLLRSLEGNGITGLTVWDQGMKLFSVRGSQPLRKPPEDFQGKTIATSGSEIDKAVIEALGAAPRELPPTQVFSALSDGDLDGQEGLWSQTYLSKLYEVQDWISVSDHVYRGFLVVIGADFWNGLSDEVRDELTRILAESTTKNRELAAEAAKEERERIEESGTAIVLGLTSSERENWRNATADVEKQFVALIGEDLIADVKMLLRQPVFLPPDAPDYAARPETLDAAQTPAEQEAAARGEPSGRSGPPGYSALPEGAEWSPQPGASAESEPALETGPEERLGPPASSTAPGR